MRRALAVTLPGLAPPTIAYVIAVLILPSRAAVITHIYLIVVACGALAVLALALARTLRATGPSAFELGLRQPEQAPGRVRQLEQLEREVSLGRQNAWDLHTRLRPTLRDTAAGRLAARRGVDLERDQERAASLLGADVWDLVRPGHAPPAQRHDPGVPADVLASAITALEQL